VGEDVYASIIHAVKIGVLPGPFTNDDFRHAYPGLGAGTYMAFLYKHRRGNSGGNSELFELVGPGRFNLLRPFFYGF
jgi:hypothetical protein